jgi:hypothetical protein
MVVLRTLAALALAVWIGGLAALGAIAAPTIFAELEARDPAAGRELAGAIVGALFQRFEWVAVVCGAIVIAALAIRAALGVTVRLSGARLLIAAGMVAITLVTTLAIAPKIDAIRRSTPTAIASLPADDPRRVMFGRLHGASNGLALLTLAGGLILLYMEMQDGREDRPALL